MQNNESIMIGWWRRIYKLEEIENGHNCLAHGNHELLAHVNIARSLWNFVVDLQALRTSAFLIGSLLFSYWYSSAQGVYGDAHLKLPRFVTLTLSSWAINKPLVQSNQLQVESIRSTRLNQSVWRQSWSTTTQRDPWKICRFVDGRRSCCHWPHGTEPGFWLN
jgi:hypothetical protein